MYTYVLGDFTVSNIYFFQCKFFQYSLFFSQSSIWLNRSLSLALLYFTYFTLTSLQFWYFSFCAYILLLLLIAFRTLKHCTLLFSDGRHYKPMLCRSYNGTLFQLAFSSIWQHTSGDKRLLYRLQIYPCIGSHQRIIFEFRFSFTVTFD